MFDLDALSRLTYIKQITLDIADMLTKKHITAKQNDINSRFLEIVITEMQKPKNIPQNATVVFRGTKPNMQSFLENGVIIEGKIYVDLSSAIGMAGCIPCDISLIDTNGSISTATFYLDVFAQPFDENAVIDTENFSALNEALVEVNSAISAYKIDQTFIYNSKNAQSGEAVAEAIEQSLGKVNDILATIVDV